MKISCKYLLLILCGFYITSFAQGKISEIKLLSEKADVILTGKVLKQKSEWDKNKTRIHTNVTVEVDEYLKGSSGDKNIIITHPGGEVGDVGELYSHMPTFKNYEDVLLFVKKDKRDMSYKVLNGEGGKLTLYSDKTTGEKVTSFNKKISTLKEEIKNYVKTQ